MPSPESGPAGRPLPIGFLEGLSGHDEVLVTSRGPAGTGTVLVWFAISPRGFVYLLTPSFSLKAQRWLEDPWIRLTVPGGGPSAVGLVNPVGIPELGDDLAEVLTRFAMAGAVTAEALGWMLESGSHQLLQVGSAPGGSEAGPVELESPR
ncbi:MAG: hypothetical protein ACYCYK_03635 [Candidatus Dormibacteria bacterium]